MAGGTHTPPRPPLQPELGGLPDSNNKRPREEADGDEDGGPDKKRASAGALDDGSGLGGDPPAPGVRVERIAARPAPAKAAGRPRAGARA